MKAAAPVVTALLQETAGNPFFLGEVVRSLLADGRDLSDRTALVAHQGVPEGVRQVIGRRLTHLADTINRILQAAAVLGDGFPADRLRATTDAAYGALVTALDEAVTAGLLRERGEEYEFGHPLIREVLYDGLRLPRRQQLHADAAAAIEHAHAANLAPHIAELATHYRLAGPAADSEQALAYTVHAAEAASAVFAWGEAARYWQVALDLMERSDAAHTAERCEALIALGAALYMGGDIPASQQAYERAAILAQSAGLSELMAQAVLGHGEPGRTPSRQDQRSIELLEQSLSLLAEGDSIVRARLLSLLAEHLPQIGTEGERKVALNAQAIAMARRLGDSATLAFALNDWHMTWCMRAMPAERLAVADEMVQLGTAAADRELILKGLRWRIGVLFALGDLAGVDRDIEGYTRIADELRAPPHLLTAVLLRSLRAGLEGRLDEGEAYIEERRSLARNVNDGEANYHFSQHGRWFELERTSPDARQALLEAVARVATPLVSSHPGWRSILVWTLLQLGRREEARQQYALLAAQDFSDLPADVVWLMTMARLSELCAYFGDQRRAALLYQRLLPCQGLFGALPGPAYPCYGAIDQYLGMLAATLSNWHEASMHFEAALSLCTRLGARPFIAHTQCAYAAMYRARHASGDEGRARDLLEQALTTYLELGMAFSAARASTTLAELASPDHDATIPDGLSPREVEVLRLLAAGKSNPEIAAILVISLFTVYRHVNHILAKSGCSNRVEAATYAHRRGIVS